MTVLFRTSEPGPQAARAYPFIPPATVKPVQLPPNVRPVEKSALSPSPSASDIIRRAEAPAPVPTEPPGTFVPLSAESLADRGQEMPERLEAAPPQLVEPEPKTRPPTESRQGSRHDKDWEGDWGRLKNILQAHDVQEADTDRQEQQESTIPKETKPRPQRLRDVQRREAQGGRTPRKEEQRRAKIEYVTPGQPVTIPEKPEDVVEAQTPIAGTGEETLPAEPEAAPGDVETAIQPAEAQDSTKIQPESGKISEEAEPEKLSSADEPDRVTQEAKPEAVPEVTEAKPTAAASEEVESAETLAQRGVSRAEEPLPTEIGEMEAETAAEEPSARKVPEKPGEEPLEAKEIKPGQTPTSAPKEAAQAIQKAEGAREEPERESESQVPLPTEQMAEKPAEDKKEPPPSALREEPVEVEAPELEREPEIQDARQPDSSVDAATPAAAPAELHGEAVSEIQVNEEEPADRQPSASYQDRVQTAIRKAEAPTEIPAQPAEQEAVVEPKDEPADEPGLGQRLLNRARRLFSREEPQAPPKQPEPAPSEPPRAPVVKATLAAPPDVIFAAPERQPEVIKEMPEVPAGEPAEAPGLEGVADIMAEPAEAPSRKAEAIQRAELAPAKEAPKPKMPEPVKPAAEAGEGAVEAVPPQEPVEDEITDYDAVETLPEVSEETGIEEGDERQAGLEAAIQRAEQQVPLEEAWPVQRIIPRRQPFETADEQVEAPVELSEAELAQRRQEVDESAGQVDEALREVAPGEYSDSTIELITPRRPRPTARRRRERSAEQAISEAEAPLPAGSRGEEQPPAKDTRALLEQDTARERPSVSEDSPAATPQPRQPGREMVPTAVGDLPSDFWRLLGQQPPSPPPTPTGDAQDLESRIQPEPSNARTAIAVAERPPLSDIREQDWSRSWGLEAAHRDSVSETVPAPTSSMRESTAEEEAAGSEEEIDIEDLAQKVYARLKTKLRIEKERNRGRF